MITYGKLKKKLLFGVLYWLMLITLGYAGDQLYKMKGKSEADIKNEIKEIIGKEKIQRDVIIKNADKAFARGRDAFEKSKYKQAIDFYLKSIRLYRKCGSGDSLKIKRRISAIQEAISLTYKFWAESLAEEGEELAKAEKYDEAIQKCIEAINMYPAAKDIIRPLMKEFEKKKQSVIYKNKISENTILPKKQQKLYRIDVLMAQAKALYNDGQWDKARDKFEEVIAINPYYVPAINFIKKCNVKLNRAGKKRYNATRLERLAENEWTYITPLIPRTLAGETETIAQPIIKSEAESKIQQKLKNIIIPHIEFEEVTIPTVIKYLKQQSKQHDPEKIGVNFFLRLSGGKKTEEATAGGGDDDDDDTGAAAGDDDDDDTGAAAGDDDDDDTGAAAGDDDDDTLGDDDTTGEGGGASEIPDTQKTVTLVVDDIPLGQAIQYICRAANLKYRIENYAVVIASQSIPLEDVETRIYPIEQEAVSEIGGEEEENAVEEYFKRRGISFPEGAKVVYDGRISRLIATNTPDNLAKIEQIIKEINVIDPQVLIQAKFVEIDQHNLQELGFEYFFSRSMEDTATARHPRGQVGDSASFGKTSTYDRNDNLVRNLKNAAISADFQRPDELFHIYYTGAAGHKAEAILHALSQMDSADVLSTPRVTTLNGQEAVIRMVTEVYYPESWGDATFSTITSQGITRNVIVSSTPSFGDATQLGIILRVTPNVDADHYTISLDMNPVVQAFIGWTDYSYELTDSNTGSVYTNTLKMPIIEARTVETTVSVYDAETIVLGGIINDRIDSFNDKYPILGDIPLIGRLFRSRAEGAIKKNLLIFLTCRLVNPDGSPIRERETRGLPPFRQ